MSLELTLFLIALFGLAGIGTPVGYSIMLASMIYLGVGGQDIALTGEKILQGLYKSFILLAVPLFITAANIMNAGTISDRLLHFCIAVVGRFRGGLGYVNVMASLIFLRNVRLRCRRRRRDWQDHHRDDDQRWQIRPRLRRRHHRRVRHHWPDYSAVYSDGDVRSGVKRFYWLALLGRYRARTAHGCCLNGDELHDFTAADFATEEPVPLRRLPSVTGKAFPALLMPVILLYGIYGGVTTPTEAAAVAAFYALLLATLFYRALTPKSLYKIFVESARSSAAVGVVIGGALILNYIVLSENIPATMSAALTGLEIHPIIFLLGVNLLVLLLGCVLDATTIILVIVPLFIPTCQALGIDLVHFGVLVVVNSMIGLITPPLRSPALRH